MRNIKSLLGSFLSNEEESVKQALIKTSFINIVARGFGYFKNLSIAYLLGFSFQTDAVFMALSLYGFFLIFVDVFDSIGVPNLVTAKMESEEKFERISGLLFTFTVILSILVVFLAIVSYPVVKLIPFGFKERTLEYLKYSYFSLVPYLFFNFIFHHVGAVLRSIRRFTQYFVGEFIFSFLSFLFVTVGLLLWRSYLVIPISMSVAQVFATFYMLFVGRRFIHFGLYYDEEVYLILKHFFYLTALYGVFYIHILVDRAFASVIGEKGVSALTYGLTIATIPKNIFRIEHIAITSLSEARGSLEKLRFYLKKTLQLTMPIMVFLIVFAELFIRLLFYHGAFTDEDVRLTAIATRLYALSLPFFFIWPILYRTFQILNWLKPVFFVAIFSILLNLILNYMFVMVFKIGIVGICLATFVSSLFLCVIGYLVLTRSRISNH
ncbi:MAG: lipid II flippase MurJ [Thermosulfidibacteraceae bacterium]|jgi:putative peptidoglycan lipid II flippase